MDKAYTLGETDHINLCYQIPRHQDWFKFRSNIIKERNCICEFSGVNTDLEAHHIIPFHIGILLNRPHIELCPQNIIILSGGPVNYHLTLGHFGHFKYFNPFLLKRNWKEKLRGLGIESPIYKKQSAHKFPFWENMTLEHKESLTKLIDKYLPKCNVERMGETSLCNWDVNKKAPNLIWSMIVDDKYLIEIQRISIDRANMIIFEAPNFLLHNECVNLTMGAIFGPAVQDIQLWEDRSFELISLHESKRV